MLMRSRRNAEEEEAEEEGQRRKRRRKKAEEEEEGSGGAGGRCEGGKVVLPWLLAACSLRVVVADSTQNKRGKEALDTTQQEGQ